MPLKHEQPTNQDPVYYTEVAQQPLALYAQVPNHAMPLIDVGGLLHHPIAEAVDAIIDIVEELITSPRLTTTQRKSLRNVIIFTDTITTELRQLAVYNRLHNDTPYVRPTKGAN